MLKGSNLIFDLLFELSPFLLLFFVEKVMFINLTLELFLFLGKITGKILFILDKPLLFLLKLLELFLVSNSLGISMLDNILKLLLCLFQR
jgi:hypothetical protein